MIRTRLSPFFAPATARLPRAPAWPIFAFSLAGLIAAGPAAAGPVLPTGGQVQAGSATIATSTGFSVTIDQTSGRAVIDWTTFSIGAGGSVRFDNGSGATLNRVTGGAGSFIGGQLSATGSVFLINPSGVIVGPNGVVSVGGAFVASSLDLTNSQFMSGGDLTFSGSGGGSVINHGAIDAAGGDAVLIGATVENDGQIHAPKGVAGLAAGSEVLLRAQTEDDGKLSVLIGGPNTSVSNSGLIAAASAELRANGGNVYALAVNTGSQIEATGVSTTDGKVFLIADGGTVVAHGQIDAVKADGSGGFVETSGQSVDFTGLSVKAGKWLIDPVDLTVDAAAAATIGANLATTNITLMTTASSASGPGVQSAGAGDITVISPISWASANTLTLDAYHSIIVESNLTATGAGKVVLKTNDGGTGGAYWFNPGSSLSFTGAPGSGQALTINGQAYNLVYSKADLLNINSNLGGFYALAAPLDLIGTEFTTAPIAGSLNTPFTGVFTGLGNRISNLTIVRSIATVAVGSTGFAGNGLVGLFGNVGAAGVIQSIHLNNALVSGGDGMTVGALVGSLSGTVFNASSSGAISVGNDVATADGPASASVGGLVGFDGGTVLDSFSSANVSGGQAFVGGLVGVAGAGASAQIVNSFATGVVAAGAWTNLSLSQPGAGGLVGLIYGFDAAKNPNLVTVTGSYATGNVSGGADAIIGGFAGNVQEGQVTTSYATGAVALTAPGVPGTNHNSGQAGGFVGYVGTGGTVSQSFASGAVSGFGGSNSTSYTLLGGFAGTADLGAAISDSYALGPVTASGNGLSATGGFAGLIEESASINTVYATGLVSGPGVLGGLAGVVGNTGLSDTSGSIANGYWDEGTTGQTVGFNLSGTGTATNIVGVGGSTGLSPYATATYGNFDLVNTWYIIAGETRPILRAEYSTTITDGHQLELMGLNLAANYTVANNIDLSETTQATGVWNPANGFVPVGGNGAAGFTGMFNGQGNTISNLTIIDTRPVAQVLVDGYPSDGVAGLFGFVGVGGQIESVNLAKANVSGGDGMWVGALAGASMGTVTDSSSSGIIVTGNETGTISNFDYAIAGGLVGGTGGSVLASNSSAVVSGGNALVGGLVGAAAHGADIANSFATGSVTTGLASASFNNTPAAGGLVGGIDGFLFGNLNPVPVTVSGSYATGAVSGGGGANVGGFVGSMTESTITTSYATGSVTEVAVGPTTFSNAVGGFAGGADNGGLITESWASGAVVTVAGPDNNTETWAGGFVGYLNASTVSDAYALGSVTARGVVFSTDGGFVGLVQNNSAASNIYATGQVRGPRGGIVGGLAGQVGDPNVIFTGGSISNGYWDEGTTGQTVGYNLAGTGTATNVVGIGGSTGLSPYATATYANFDLVNAWYMIAGETRPILRSEYSTTITDGHQLELIGLNLGASYTQSNNIDLSEDTLATGVWNPANGFVPIGGNGAGPFTGVLNGRGFAITNLTIIDTTAVPQAYAATGTNGFVGLFGNAGAGSLLQNINLVGATVTGGDGMRVGALAGADAGSMVGDSSSGLITVGNGGIIGGPSNVQIVASAGGLAGADTGSILNSHSSATVTVGNDAYVGGLVGSFFGAGVTGSYATGNVSTGAHVDGNPAIDPLAGGLFGLLGGGAAVTQSYATGNVIGGGGSWVGGFVGSDQTAGQISLSYATGGVTQTAGGQGGGNDYAGGFVGGAAGGTIIQSFATGAVTTVGGSAGLNTFAGGFVGDAGGETVATSYSTGAVTVTGSTFSRTGGFAGLIEGGANVSFVYATGLVTSSGRVGGLAGQVGVAADTVASTLTNSVWDEGSTGQTVGYTLIGPGTATADVGVGGATGINPFLAASYAGWDFTNTWSPPSAGFYPELYGASHVLRVTAPDVTFVYGTFPIYTFNVYGLQGGDSADIVQGLTLGAIGTTTASSGFYSVGTYGLSPLTTPTTVYRAFPVFGALTVTPASLIASLIGTVEKTYDGTTSATLTAGNYQLTGLIAGDSVNLNNPTSGTYASQNAGTGILVTVGGLILTGADAGNYTFGGSSASAAIGIIDPKALSVALIGTVEKTYDGTAGATLTAGNYQLTGLIAGDSVSINNPASGTYASQNVGTGILVTVGGLTLTGASAGNYTFGGGSASAAIGIIDPKLLSASLVGTVEKTFDGTTTAILTAGNYSLTGVITGDSVSLNDPSAGTYASPFAGTGIVVTAGGLALTGAQAGNYAVNVSASAPVGIIDSPPPPIQTSFVVASPAAQLSGSDDPGAAADAGSPPAGVVDVGGSTDSGSPTTGADAGGSGGTSGSGDGGSTAADGSGGTSGSDGSGSTAADVSAGAAEAAAQAAKSTGTASVFPVAKGGDNDRNGSDNSPVTGGGNRDLWTGSEEGGQNCSTGQDKTQACDASRGAKP